MDDTLNEPVSIMLIAAAGIFVAAVSALAIRQRVRAVLAARRRLDRPIELTVVAGEPQLAAVATPDQGTDIQAIFDDFDRRFERLEAEIDALIGGGRSSA